jgi:hypothetical protein
MESPPAADRNALLERAIKQGHAWLSETATAGDGAKCDVGERIARARAERNAQPDKNAQMTMRQRSRQIAECQSSNAKRHPGATGTVLIRWTVSKDDTKVIATDPDTAETSDFAGCITNGLQKWFGAASARQEPYEYRFPLVPEPHRPEDDIEL